MRNRTKARERALQMLYQREVTKDDIEKIADDFWRHHALEESAKDFALKLVQGTLDNIHLLDEMIANVADNWELKRMAIIDRNILRLASFELIFLGDIPPKVSINEAVELAKRFGDVDSGKFVNGILDKIAISKFNEYKKE